MTDGTTTHKGVVPYLTEEIDHFDQEVQRFRAGQVIPEEFTRFRLRQGVYGQRQPDVQMFRIKIPGGIVTAEQLEALGQIARDYAPRGKGHITTRENIQFHFLKLDQTAEMMRIIGEAGLTSREACGNTVRNVVTCPLAGVCRSELFDLTPYLGAYVRRFVRHPVTQNMPRKFKTAFSPCPTDCALTPMHDLGFIAQVREEGGVPRKGFKVVVGGGTSIQPTLALTLYDFVPVEDYLRIAEAVLRVFNKADDLRKNHLMARRMKVLIRKIGIDAFRQKVEEELKEPWAQEPVDPTPLFFFDEAEQSPPPPNGHQDIPAPREAQPAFALWRATNVVRQKQAGFCSVYIKVPMGDLTTEQFFALAEISRKFSNGRARLSSEQNLALRWVRESALYGLWQELERIGLAAAGVHEITDVTACPGTDSCKLGITSSMGLGRAIQKAVEEMEIQDPLVRQIRIKISACPNGCGRHHLAQIGFHGAAIKGAGNRQVPAYEVFVGGLAENGAVAYGQHLAPKIPAKRVPEAVQRMVSFYQTQRHDGETFNRFVLRVGARAFEPVIADLRHIDDQLTADTIPLYIDWERDTFYKLERGEGECAV